MFKENQFSNLRILEIKGKEVYVVDRHQYTLPIWASYALKTEKEYTLVSIDFHPDTNPAFFQLAHLKAMNKDISRIDELTENFSRFEIEKIDRCNIDQVIEKTNHLNNDEHINTAISLSYIKDYHMINCMDEHEYEVGKHYLLDKAYFGDISDEMFKSIHFEVPNEPIILDIDLDFFLKKSNFKVKNHKLIKELVNKASIITIARSIKYFEYLKQESFLIDECESLCLDFISNMIDEK